MWRTPPFRKAPGALFRRPAILASIIGTATILVTVSSLTPLFMSSASSAALQRELAGRCSASFGGQTINFAPIPLAREALSDAVSQDPVLGTPRLYLEGTLVDGENANGRGTRTPVRFVARDGFREQIELTAGAHGSGAYIDEYAADFLEMGPGDSLQFTPLGGEPRTIEVTAIYENLYNSQRHPYWCSLEQITLRNAQGELPPLIILIDPEEFSGDPVLFDSLFAQYARSLGDWEIPVSLEGLTVTDALRAAETLEIANEVIHEEGEEVPAFFGRPNLLSDLALVSGRVQNLVRALESSAVPLAGIVVVAGLALVAGAGSYWVDRNASELRLLSAYGASPLELAGKASLETAPALLLSGVTGWAIANLLIGVVGPSPDIEGSARIESAWAAAAATGAALIVVTLVTAIRSKNVLDTEHSNKKPIPWRIPTLLLAFAGMALIRQGIGESAVETEENQLVGFVDPLVLFFPLAAFVAVVLLASEILLRVAPLIGRAGRRGHAAYLASRRIISAPSLVVGLIAGAALPVATLVYAASLTRSTTSTIEAKGQTFIGADVSTPVYGIPEIPASLAGNSTIVVKTERASLNGETVDVVAIDEETFLKGAAWDDTYAETDPASIVDSLSRSSSGALRAYVANGSAADGTLLTRSGDIEVEIVGQLNAFPSAEANRPLVVVSQRTYLEAIAPDGVITGSRILLWSMDVDPARVETALADANVGFAYTLSAEAALDQLKFAAVIWTFDFLEVYSMLAGLIAIGGVLLYVDARQRSRNLSYVLARRMGLSRKDHLIGGIIEVAGLALLGSISGILTGSLAARSLFGALDPVPGTPPGPRWVGAIDIAGIALILAVAVGIGAAALAQRTADRANAQELLTHGD